LEAVSRESFCTGYGGRTPHGVDHDSVAYLHFYDRVHRHRTAQTDTAAIGRMITGFQRTHATPRRNDVRCGGRRRRRWRR